jgi:hypothetical protein
MIATLAGLATLVLTLFVFRVMTALLRASGSSLTRERQSARAIGLASLSHQRSDLVMRSS